MGLDGFFLVSFNFFAELQLLDFPEKLFCLFLVDLRPSVILFVSRVEKLVTDPPVSIKLTVKLGFFAQLGRLVHQQAIHILLGVVF